MAGVILASYVLVVLGALVALVGFVARRRDRPAAGYLFAAGAVLVAIGFVGIGFFVSGFG